MKKTVSGIMLTLLLICMLTLVFSVPTVGAGLIERRAGVDAGDWVEYKNYSFSWASNVPFDELKSDIKSFIKSYDDLCFWKVTVLEISDTLVKYQWLWHFKNGTEWVAKTYWEGKWVNACFVDIETGDYSNMIFIAANLSAGNSIYTYYPDWIITGTIKKEYLGDIREVNVLLNKIVNYTVESRTVTYNFTIIWDRLTGILLEWQGSEEIREENQTVICNLSLKITGTNRWGHKTANATVDINPETLNLRSKGKWITAYIKLPEGYDVADINVSTVMLNGTVPAELSPTAIGDYDNDAVPDFMVKFDRAEVISYILANVNMTELIEERFMTITLTITGKLNDGTPFQGSDTIKIIYIDRNWEMLLAHILRYETYMQRFCS